MKDNNNEKMLIEKWQYKEYKNVTTIKFII